ncbi:unnamed protein product, partial [Musa hybrid cultivar]
VLQCRWSSKKKHMLAVANVAERRRRRLLFHLMILCSIWVFFKPQDGGLAVPVLHRENMITTRRLDSPGIDNLIDESKRRAPSSPDPLHNRDNVNVASSPRGSHSFIVLSRALRSDRRSRRCSLPPLPPPSTSLFLPRSPPLQPHPSSSSSSSAAQYPRRRPPP